MLLCKTGLFYICDIPIPMTLFPFTFSFPLVAQKLSPFPWDSHGNEIPMEIPIPMHSVTVHCLRVLRAWSDQRRVVLSSTTSSVERSRRRRDDGHAWWVDHVAALRLDVSEATAACARHTVSFSVYSHSLWVGAVTTVVTREQPVSYAFTLTDNSFNPFAFTLTRQL